MYSFGKDDWRTFDRGIEKEWLVTNGIGGYASSTIIGANTRKYHGLLVAAHNPPGRRVVHLVKLDERLVAGGRTYNLAANCSGYGVSESGYIHLQQVRIGYVPSFTYSFADITLEKIIFMVHGRNTSVILYRLNNGSKPGTLYLTPLVNCRGYHFITSEGQVDFKQNLIAGGVYISSSRAEVSPLSLTAEGGALYVPDGKWYKGMAYAAEKERGENYFEDHYIPGYFEVPLTAGESKTIAVFASTEALEGGSGEELLEKEIGRRRGLEKQAGYQDDLACRLVRAADAFIVQRQSTAAKTVIAGYPWFTDWGRDTMIALPGLTLVTKRFKDAEEILLTFARLNKNGLLPNCFQDGAERAMYNTVDASLWYFHAVYKYLVYTGDLDFVHNHVYPVLKDIINCYISGTDYNISMDQDGLLSAGAPGVQLTWMDAKIDDWVVTPRHGKAVEINALWYNALCVMEKLARIYGDEALFDRDLVRLIKSSFLSGFWNESEHYLADVISPEGKDWRIRPNQLLAVSLPFSMLTQGQGQGVVRKVWQELYATYGIRSLSPESVEYRGVYIGDRVQRDGAYHQGTAWSWLVGPFITAFRRAHEYSAPSREQARRFIMPFLDHLRTHGIGYISEIFDANEPILPRGCFAQAWGVAEILRSYVEDVLEIHPPEEKRINPFIKKE
ncbi:MAG: amylo-alpha-1,6-glucosidase [Desulfotomaculaceae bacterium]|nr:amylo-alpha-1,6-glucosidase [Desulfotomaculaceae bacterium]